MSHPLDTISRQTKFLNLYKETKDPTLAAGEAWPELPPRRRAQMAKRTITQPEVSALLDRYTLSLPKLIKRHRDALDAKKTININGMVDEVPNDEVRLKALEMAYKLHGLLKNKETVETNHNVQVTIDPTKLAEVAARLEAVNAKMLPNREKVVDADIIQ